MEFPDRRTKSAVAPHLAQKVVDNLGGPLLNMTHEDF